MEGGGGGLEGLEGFVGDDDLVSSPVMKVVIPPEDVKVPLSHGGASGMVLLGVAALETYMGVEEVGEVDVYRIALGTKGIGVGVVRLWG
jgi:hypothetical protein